MATHSRAKWRSSPSACSSVLEKDLTLLTLLQTRCYKQGSAFSADWEKWQATGMFLGLATTRPELSE